MAEDSSIFFSKHIHILLENDLILRECACLIGAEDIHFTEGLDRTETFHDRLFL